jgi:hypothetical protein
VQQALQAGINMAAVAMPAAWQQHPQLSSFAQPTQSGLPAQGQEVPFSISSQWQQQQHQQQWQGPVAPSSSSTEEKKPSSSAKMSAQKLTRQIQSCHSTTELELLLQTCWLQLDHIHISAAVVQLARLRTTKAAAAAAAMDPRPQDVLDTRSSSSGRSSGVSSSSSSNGVALENSSSSSSNEALLARLLDSASDHLDSMHSRHIANLLWGCGSLNHKPSECLLNRLLHRAEGFLKAGTNTQGFANIIWGLASLKVCPSESWLASFFAASQPHLSNFQAQELSSTVWALASLAVQPPLTWQQSYLAASTAKAGISSAQALSNQFWAIAKLHLVTDESWMAAMTYACQIRAEEFSPGNVMTPFCVCLKSI